MLLPILILSFMTALVLPAKAQGTEFSTTNLQILYGSQFKDRYFGNNTSNGNMTTLTLEHFSTWSYGDNYFFADLLSGDFVGFTGTPTGKQSHIYAEWNPRISLSQLSGQDLSAGIIRDLFISGQLNRDGEGFHAELIGGAVDLQIPGFHIASIHLYWRKDNFNKATWQTTMVWLIPMGNWLSLGGFADLYGSDNNGTEISTQPQLLLDIGRIFDAPDKLQAGVEWYYHKNRHMRSSVPQAMVKWTW